MKAKQLLETISSIKENQDATYKDEKEAKQYIAAMISINNSISHGEGEDYIDPKDADTIYKNMLKKGIAKKSSNGVAIWWSKMYANDDFYAELQKLT